MASVKIKFHPSSIAGKKGRIYYQIIHNRTIRQIETGYKVFECEWNGKASAIKVPAWISDERKNSYRRS